MGVKMNAGNIICFWFYAWVVMLECRGVEVGRVEVVGSAECHDCIDSKQALLGMGVAIACRGGEEGRLKITSGGGGSVDGEGRFRLPFSSNGEDGEGCSVVLHPRVDGLQLCHVPPMAGWCKTVESMPDGRRELRLFGKLLFSSSSCSSSPPWYRPKFNPWKKKKKPFLLIPFPPKCKAPLPPLAQPPPFLSPSPIWDNPNPPQPLPPPVFQNPPIFLPPPPPASKNPPIFLPPPPPASKKAPIFLPPPPLACKNPPIDIHPPPPALETPPVFLPPPPPALKKPPVFLPPPPPACENPPVVIPPSPPALKNPPIFLPPPPPEFQRPPIFETPFNPPPPPLPEYVPVPWIPKFLPPKPKKPCPPVYKGPEWVHPKYPGHPKLGFFWYPVPP